MPRSKSSKRWLREHHQDYWVERARAEGWRSRAAFKLLEIQRKDRLLRPGMRVLDLGAAPGSWSQVAAREVGARGIVVASDLLEMDPIAGVTFIQGDFREQEVLEQLLAALGDEPVDLVMSDMAPNLSGIRTADQAAAMYLAELALDMARRVLAPEGTLVVKVFQGEGIDDFRRDFRETFKRVSTRKPVASRDRSPELYLVGSGLKMV